MAMKLSRDKRSANASVGNAALSCADINDKAKKFSNYLRDCTGEL